MCTSILPHVDLHTVHLMRMQIHPRAFRMHARCECITSQMRSECTRMRLECARMRRARMRLYASHVQNAAHHSMRLYAHACIASQMRPAQNVSECNRMSTVQNVIWLVVHAKYAPPNNAHICKQNVWVKK